MIKSERERGRALNGYRDEASRTKSPENKIAMREMYTMYGAKWRPRVCGI